MVEIMVKINQYIRGGDSCILLLLTIVSYFIGYIIFKKFRT